MRVSARTMGLSHCSLPRAPRTTSTRLPLPAPPCGSEKAFKSCRGTDEASMAPISSHALLLRIDDGCWNPDTRPWSVTIHVLGAPCLSCPNAIASNIDHFISCGWWRCMHGTNTWNAEVTHRSDQLWSRLKVELFNFFPIFFILPGKQSWNPLL